MSPNGEPSQWDEDEEDARLDRLHERWSELERQEAILRDERAMLVCERTQELAERLRAAGIEPQRMEVGRLTVNGWLRCSWRVAVGSVRMMPGSDPDGWGGQKDRLKKMGLSEETLASLERSVQEVKAMWGLRELWWRDRCPQKVTIQRFEAAQIAKACGWERLGAQLEARELERQARRGELRSEAARRV